ncbi:MAG: hypothetical protein ACTSW4_07185, partial [Candidatus Ranarchaeia archaeon]
TILIGLGLGLYFEWKNIKTLPLNHKRSRADFYNFLAVFLGAIFTFYMANYLSLGVVVAAAVTAICFDAIAPRYGVAAYSGAFIGMTEDLLFSRPETVLICAFLGGCIYVVTTDIFGGFGGKLGTIAFTSAILTVLGISSESIGPLIVPEGWIWLIILSSVFGAVITFYISVELRRGGVFASGFVGLLAGLLLPTFHHEIGNIVAITIFCASFAGMSTNKRFPHIGFLAIVGLVIGLSFIFSTTVFMGLGGKLGTIAFGSGIAVRGYIDVYTFMKTRDKTCTSPGLRVEKTEEEAN